LIRHPSSVRGVDQALVAGCCGPPLGGPPADGAEVDLSLIPGGARRQRIRARWAPCGSGTGRRRIVL